ncbi:MAG TPA: hypothetical protein VJO16_15630 [Candidatus Acidoferrum sp.]|nr:hypothetical protein [Candidatus Acidoferrum sp.]
MNQNLIARVIAVVLLGVFFSAYMNHDYQKWRSLGRGQFLAHEAERFDRTISAARPFGVMATGAVIGVGFLVGIYELVVFGLSAVLKSTAPPQQTQADNRGIPFR